jgi:hypothetical protein
VFPKAKEEAPGASAFVRSVGRACGTVTDYHRMMVTRLLFHDLTDTKKRRARADPQRIHRPAATDPFALLLLLSSTKQATYSFGPLRLTSRHRNKTSLGRSGLTATVPVFRLGLMNAHGISANVFLVRLLPQLRAILGRIKENEK